MVRFVSVRELLRIQHLMQVVMNFVQLRSPTHAERRPNGESDTTPR